MTAIGFRMGHTAPMHDSLRPPFGPGNIWSATCCCVAALHPLPAPTAVIWQDVIPSNGSEHARSRSDVIRVVT